MKFFNWTSKAIQKTELKMKTILCIPGNWNDISDVVISITNNNVGEFLFAGRILLNLKTNISFELQICERDKGMKESFKLAGRVNRLSDDFLNKIDSHKYVVYITSETGSLESSKLIAEAGLALLKAGGIGIKVESTGKAFNHEQWFDFLDNYEEANLYEMFVLDSIVDGSSTYSCGMHNLGLKDTIVSGENFQYSVDLISTFGLYQMLEKPTVRNNQTFSVAVDSPVLEIIEEKNQPNKGHELFENPYGMWRLQRR